MRTLIDIPEKQIKDLAVICESENISRAEVVRQAITFYLEKKKPAMSDAFGLWRNKKIDGLEYQERVRSEW